MRTIPPIRHDAFTNPSQREVIKAIADALRQVSGGLARSILPGTAPPSNPVPSSVSAAKSRAGAVAGTVLTPGGIADEAPTWTDPATSDLLTGFLLLSGRPGGQTVTTPETGAIPLIVKAILGQAVDIFEVTDDADNPIFTVSAVNKSNFWTTVRMYDVLEVMAGNLRLQQALPGTYGTFNVSALTANRTYTLPDADGPLGGFPATHYEAGGADPIKLDNLATPDDNTDLNASATRHGLLPKLPNIGLGTFLNDQGVWGPPVNPAGTYNLSGIAASISPTFLISPIASHAYLITAYVRCTTAGQATDSVYVTIGWKDNVAQTRVVPFIEDELIQGSVNSLPLSLINNTGQGSLMVFCSDTTAMTYATTMTNAAGTPNPVHNLRIRVIDLG